MLETCVCWGLPGGYGQAKLGPPCKALEEDQRFFVRHIAIEDMRSSTVLRFSTRKEALQNNLGSISRSGAAKMLRDQKDDARLG